MNAERRILQYRVRGLIPPEKLTKKQWQNWEYMRYYSEETNYSAIAKRVKVTRHRAAKWFELIRGILPLEITER